MSACKLESRFLFKQEQKEEDVLSVLDFALPLHQTVFYKTKPPEEVNKRQNLENKRIGLYWKK